MGGGATLCMITELQKHTGHQDSVVQVSVIKNQSSHGLSRIKSRSNKIRSSRIGHHTGHQESVNQESVIKIRSSHGSSKRPNRKMISRHKSISQYSIVTDFSTKGDVSPVVLPFHSLFLSAFPATPARERGHRRVALSPVPGY